MATPAQRDVDVIAKPGRKTDVPARPEIAEAGREIGMVEIQHQPQAHHPRDAAGHVGIAAEIAVDLPGESERGRGESRAVVPLRRRVNRVDVECQVIRDRQLFEQARDEQGQPVGHLADRQGGQAAKLDSRLRTAFDRSRDELREKRDERREANKAVFGLQNSPVAVDHVAHRLEREERDPHRQNNVGNGNSIIRSRQRQQRADLLDEKSGVLEKAQQDEVVSQAEHQPQLLARAALDQQHGDEINDRGIQNKQQVQRVPPPVKNVGNRQQPVQPKPRRPQRQVNRIDDQKEKREGPGVKQHSARFSQERSSLHYARSLSNASLSDDSLAPLRWLVAVTRTAAPLPAAAESSDQP